MNDVTIRTHLYQLLVMGLENNRCDLKGKKQDIENLMFRMNTCILNRLDTVILLKNKDGQYLKRRECFQDLEKGIEDIMLVIPHEKSHALHERKLYIYTSHGKKIVLHHDRLGVLYAYIHDFSVNIGKKQIILDLLRTLAVELFSSGKGFLETESEKQKCFTPSQCLVHGMDILLEYCSRHSYEKKENSDKKEQGDQMMLSSIFKKIIIIEDQLYKINRKDSLCFRVDENGEFIP